MRGQEGGWQARTPSRWLGGEMKGVLCTTETHSQYPSPTLLQSSHHPPFGAQPCWGTEQEPPGEQESFLVLLPPFLYSL